MYNTETRKGWLIVTIVLYLVSSLLQLPTLIKSGLFNEIGKEITGSWIVCLLLILLAAKLLRSAAKTLIAGVCAILLFANWSQVMLYFSSHEPYEDVLKNVRYFALIILGSVILAWCCMSILKKCRNLICAVLPLLFVLAASFVSRFIDPENNTSTVYILGHSIQPAFFLAFMILVSFAGYFERNNGMLTRISYLISFFVLMGVMVISKEYGLPFMCYGACTLIYICFFHSNLSGKKRKINSILFVLIPIVLFLTAILVMPELKESFVNKISTRTGEENSQIKAAISNLQISGLLGTYKYHYLPEASSDYSLNTDIHYWGYLWSIIMYITFSLACVLGTKELSQSKRNNIIDNLQKVVFGMFLFLMLYNILFNICLAPVIGVQMLFSGVSKGVAVLSGGMLGVLIYDRKLSKEDLKHNLYKGSESEETE